VSIGSDAQLLTQALLDQFPDAEPAVDDPVFAQSVTRVMEYLDHPTSKFDLPLDIRGTAFQQRVWQALREIPAGKTASYNAIAERIGAPKAARAVAQACAANKLAVIIPCHRVLHSDGSLSGYRWGVERKKALLDLEARLSGS